MVLEKTVERDVPKPTVCRRVKDCNNVTTGTTHMKLAETSLHRKRKLALAQKRQRKCNKEEKRATMIEKRT